MAKKKVGLIVNPLAGIGGRVGLKGSDGAETVEQAFELGAEPVAPNRAMQTLEELRVIKNQIELVTYPEAMGENEARQCGFEPVVLGEISTGHTTAADTQKAAREVLDYGVDLLVFAGGDGTARDIYSAIGQQLPVVGIPSGVKIHSSVYAINPRRAADLIRAYLKDDVPVREMEVMDIDEEAFRAGQVSAELYGYLKVPYQPQLVQAAKMGSSGGDSDPAAIAEHIVELMDDDDYYVLGPGTTVKAVGDALGIEKTLLGVDVVHQRKLVARDVNERQLLELLDGGKQAKIVVTIIGGQGYIFGRGNQQISPQVIRTAGTDNILIIATKSKLGSLERTLLVDTGDAALDEELAGYIKVITGYREMVVRKVEA